MSQALESVQQEANCLSRFDRLTAKKELLKIVAVLAAVSVVEAFDLGLIGQTVLVLKKIWNLTAAQTGLLATCSTIGVVLGTLSCGFLSDRYGRKRVLFWAVFVFTLFTFTGPLVENFYWVVAMRFLSGLGSGAVFPIPYLYISELVGAKQRGVIFGYCNAILVFSYILPSAFGAWAVANFPLETAWKLPFLVGGLPIVMLYFIHKYMPESPRWLLRKGRLAEAESLVEKLEASMGLPHDKAYVDPQILASVHESRKSGLKKASWVMLFKPPYLIRSLVSWSMFSAALVFWYVVMVYAPTILTAKGFQMSSSVLMGGIMMLIGGISGIICGHMIERFGRKTMYIWLALLSAACSVLLTVVDGLAAWLLIGSALAFFGNAIFSICKLYIAEQYPTEIRGIGAGMGEAVSRICGGVLATYFIAFLISSGDRDAVFIFLAACYLVSVALLAIFGQETMGKSVDATGSAISSKKPEKEDVQLPMETAVE